MRLGLVVNSERPGAEKWSKDLLIFLAKLAGSDPLLISYIDPRKPFDGLPESVPVVSLEDLVARSEVVFSLGGDGTMLGVGRAIVRSSSSAKLIGVNLGRLGFIADNQPEELEVLVEELAAGRLIEEKRLLVSAMVGSEASSPEALHIRRGPAQMGAHNSGEQFVELIGLNEIIVDNFGSTRMLTFEIRIDGSLLGTMRADGLILATPTGSTGYAVSAGGPIVEPSSPVLLITPIAPHSLNVRPVIVPDNVTIQVRVHSDESMEALIVADGQEEVVARTPATVSVTASKKQITLLHRSKSRYYDRLRDKLLWSIDARDESSMRR